MCRNKISTLSSYLIDHVMRQISSASLPETHPCAQTIYIDFGGDNFIFGELVYRRVGLSASWLSAILIVGELVCRRVVQLP